MIKNILSILQIVVLIIVAVLLAQMWRKFKSIPEDEVIGEERAKYLNARLGVLMGCVIAEAALSITQTLLRLFANY